MAAEKVSPEAINFMAKYGRGLICISLTEQRIGELRLPMMVSENTSRFQTAFTVSVDACTGVTTGISAADRACTVSAMVDEQTKPEDLVSPGHIFPAMTVPVRTGQTEGSTGMAGLLIRRLFVRL
jgi:3,4-dihydroxy 2-butanone 4-phosphate synthase/GTP cyclohydrolase II